MAVDIGGLVAIIVFYVIILAVGLWAARKTGFKTKNLKINDLMLANRSLNTFLGFFTITATAVGGGYINGSTEIVSQSGLVWCQAPIGFGFSLIFGAFFFVDKMRSSGFTTMLDPFHWKFGKVMNCLLYFPALTGDIFWSGAILAALGATLKVILDIDLDLAIIVSAAISLMYTLMGGLYSVAYTDVVQLIFIFIGLWLCLPFSMSHDATVSITTNNADLWLGKMEVPYIANYIDYWLLLICGGIPWQVYWQRALSAKSAKVAKIFSYVGAIGTIVMSIPAVLMGAVAASTDWNQTDYGQPKITADDVSLTLPLVMKHLCPTAVTFVGLGAVSAAVMSSTDSSILSSSSMFSRNVYSVIYTVITRRKPSETMLVWVMRAAQVVIAVLACVTAIKVKSVYSLFLLCSDLVYVLLFPQFLCVIYMKKANSYGSIVGFISGTVLRLLGGEVGIGLTATIHYRWYADGVQLFPFRTLSMLVSLFSIIIVSMVTDFLFTRRILPLKLDVFSCFTHTSKDSEGEMTSSRQTSTKYPSNDSADGLRKRDEAFDQTRM